jgi:hypothetical protein
MSAIPCISSFTVPSQGTTDAWYGLGTGAHAFRNSEANVHNKWRTPGTFSQFFLVVALNDLTGPSTGRVRKNGGNGNQVVTITAATTGLFQDITNTDVVAAGDTVAYQTTTTGSGAGISVTTLGVLFAATANTVARFTNYEGGAVANGDEQHLAGFSPDIVVEANAQNLFRTDGTLKNGGVNITSNTRDGASTYRLRKNGGSGNLILSVTAATTGWFEDLVNTDSVVSGDLCNWALAIGGATGSVTQRVCAVDFETTDGTTMQYAAQFGAITAGLTRYIAPSGSSQDPQAAEATVAALALADGLVSRLHVFVAAGNNTCTTPSTVTYRVGLADGNQALSIPGLTVGAFEDTTNTDSVDATDRLAVKIVTGAAGSLTLQTVGQLWGQTSGDPVVQTRAATGIRHDRATIRGRIDPNGQAMVGWFEWGTDPDNLDQVTDPVDVGAGGSFVSISEVLEGLTRATTYYFRAVGSTFGSPGGSPDIYGETLSFTTLDEHLFIDGDVSHPLTAMHFIDRDGEQHSFAEVDLNDASDYENGYKAPRVVRWLDVSRGFSDRTGQVEHMTFGAVLSDIPRFFRALLDDPTNRYLTNRPFWEKMIDDEDRRVEGLWRYIANGFVSDYAPTPELQFRLTGCDWLKKKFSRKAKAQRAWQPLITIDKFPECPPGTLGKAAPLIYGKMDDSDIQTVEIGTTAPYDSTIANVNSLICEDFHSLGNVNGLVTALVIPVVGGDEGPVSNPAGTVDFDRAQRAYWNHQGTADSYAIYFFDGAWGDWTPHGGLRAGATVSWVRRLTHDNSTMDGGAIRDFAVTLTSIGDGTDALSGVTTAAVDQGHGTVKPIYVGIVDPFTEGPWHLGLVARGAVHSIRELYVDGIAQRIATDPTQAGAGLGSPSDSIWLIPGYPGWDAELPDPYLEIGGDRYTVIYGRVGYPGPDRMAGVSVAPATPGAEPSPIAVGVTLNVWGIEDIGDGDGEVIESLPQQQKHFMRNFLAGNEPPGLDWRATCPTFEHEPTLDVIDETTFDDVEDEWEVINPASPSGIRGAFVIGANGELVAAMDVLAQFHVSGDWNGTFTRKGQFMISIEPSEVPEDLIEVDDIINILADSFEINDQVSSEFFNILPYTHTRDYTGIVDGGWGSLAVGEVDVRDEDSITNYDQERDSPVFELAMLRSEVTGDDVIALVMERKLARYRHPLRTAAGAVPLGGTEIEVGSLFRMTHVEGIGASGWQGRLVRCSGHVLDPNMNRVLLRVYDVEPLIGGSP